MFLISFCSDVLLIITFLTNHFPLTHFFLPVSPQTSRFLPSSLQRQQPVMCWYYHHIIKQAFTTCKRALLCGDQQLFVRRYDCRSIRPNRYFIKFSDDTALLSLLSNDEVGHGPVLNDFVAWCDRSYLCLNATKTKDVH